MVDLEFGIPTFPLICLICFYMFANSLLYCHLVCKVHNKPTATPFFPDNDPTTKIAQEHPPCQNVYGYFSISLWKKREISSQWVVFLNQLRWWVFVLPGPVSRQNSSMCQGEEKKWQDFSKRRCWWLMWMVGTFLVRKDWWNFGWTFFSSLRMFLPKLSVLGMSSSMAKDNTKPVCFPTIGEVDFHRRPFIRTCHDKT